LGQLQNILEMTDAQRPLLQQMQDPQPRLVTQAPVDLDQVHKCNCRYIPIKVYSRQARLPPFFVVAEISGQGGSHRASVPDAPPFRTTSVPAALAVRNTSSCAGDLPDSARARLASSAIRGFADKDLPTHSIASRTAIGATFPDGR
jgi:hypothetical protein